jgi:hypothetical protein
MYAVLILSPLPSVIPFGGEKKNEIQHKKKKGKKSLRGSDRLKSAPPLIAGV